MTISKIDSFIIEDIAPRIFQLRDKYGIAKQDLCNDGELIKCIENKQFKKRNGAFIPSKALNLICWNLNDLSNETFTPYKIVFKDDNGVYAFLKKVWDYILLNSHTLTSNQLIHFDEDLISVTEQAIKALYFDGAFSLSWSKFGENSLLDFDQPNDLESEQSFWDFNAKNLEILKTTGNTFFDQIKRDLFDSFIKKFSPDQNQISLLHFEKRVKQWINASLPQIINDQIQFNEDDPIYSIGYAVRNIMDKRHDILAYYYLPLEDKSMHIESKRNDLLKLATTYLNYAKELSDRQKPLL